MRLFTATCAHCGNIQTVIERHRMVVEVLDPIPPCPTCREPGTITVTVEEKPDRQARENRLHELYDIPA